jgi:hypothetical protein
MTAQNSGFDATTEVLALLGPYIELCLPFIVAYSTNVYIKGSQGRFLYTLRLRDHVDCHY